MADCTENDFLPLREKLKQEIRNKHMLDKQHQCLPLSFSVTSDIKKSRSGDDYGSFFGPSLPSVAIRVIEQCKVLHPNLTSEKAEKIMVLQSKLKEKVIKEARDYSFLFSDDTSLQVKSDSTKSKTGLKKPALSSTKNNVGHTIGKIIPKARRTEKLSQTNMTVSRPKKRPFRKESADDNDTMTVSRPKKRPFRKESADDDDVHPGNYSKIIRGIFNYNPRKYVKDDRDDMKIANFDEVRKEENRSTKLGKKEDDEELQKIIQENKRELMMKKKKRI